MLLHPKPSNKVALIATLGGKAQVVTFALDCLQQMGQTVQRVIVVHLAPSDIRIQRALHQLRQCLANDYAQPIRFENYPIRDQPDAEMMHKYWRGLPISGRAIMDEDDFALAEASRWTFHRLISAVRNDGYQIELCMTGGPRAMGFQAMTAATLAFASHDRCWHLYTPRSVREKAGEGQILHLSADSGIRLVSVPLLPIGAVFPNLQMAMNLSPDQILREGHQYIDQQELQRCKQVLQHLTPRQRQVLYTFATQPDSDAKQIAALLSIGLATLHTHKTCIYGECRNAWELPEGEPSHPSFLGRHFGALPNEVWREFGVLPV